MPGPPRKFSINEHFRREAVIPAIVFGAILGVAALAAVFGPWISQHFLIGALAGSVRVSFRSPELRTPWQIHTCGGSVERRQFVHHL
jgi:hypothetical protein